jgi:hypothetical protein
MQTPQPLRGPKPQTPANNIQQYVNALELFAERFEEVADTLNNIEVSLVVISRYFHRRGEQDSVFTPDDLQEFEKLQESGDGGEEDEDGNNIEKAPA